MNSKTSQRQRRLRNAPRLPVDPAAPPAGFWNRFQAALSEPVNGASLALFRIAVGLVMVLEAWTLARPDLAAISSGRSPLETYYTGAEITFHFPFELFSWLPLLPARWIHLLVLIQGVAGLMMAFGLFYRVSAAAVFLTWGYLWVVESTRTYWQSHYYLETLLTFLMIWMPAARRYSVDAWLARKRQPPATVPRWTLLLLRGQLLIAYFYAGVAKLNPDWLLDAMPLRWFMAQPHVTAPYAKWLGPGQIAAFKGFLQSPEVAYFLSYTGLAFDLAIGFLLLVRRTRIFGLVLMLVFHATNHLLIFDDIGWFPLVGILTALIFLDPDWPERFGKWLRQPRITKPDWKWFAGGAVAVPIVGAALGWKLRPSDCPPAPPERLARGVASFVVVWLLWQALMPLRHYFIPGDGRFTYEGLSLSWRLKSEARRSYAVQLFVIDPNIVSGGQINWNEWRGDQVVYRTVAAGRINWQVLPEIFALVEPIVGERVIYNPYPANVRTEAEARERLGRIWNEMYGRPPNAVRAALTLSQILESLAATTGNREERAKLTGVLPRAKQLDQFQLLPPQAAQAHAEVVSVINELRDRVGPSLWTMEPLALDGERSGGMPFLIIDDPPLITQPGKGLPRIARRHWKHSPSTRSPNRPGRDVGAEPLVIHLGAIGPESRGLLPRACVFDSQDQPGQAPYIWWNAVSDLPLSKVLHISYQAFYLRRYARRVAALWQEEYGRTPSVQASTAVSLNGRPHQALVDPAVDLGGVPVSWFSHNFWIRQLETPRIPRAALDNPPVL